MSVSGTSLGLVVGRLGLCYVLAGTCRGFRGNTSSEARMSIVLMAVTATGVE